MDINDLNQEIIKLSRKHNLTQEEIKVIWNYQFKKIMKLIKENRSCDIKVRGLGTFKFNKYKDIKITELINKKKDEREIYVESSPKDGDGDKLN